MVGKAVNSTALQLCAEPAGIIAWKLRRNGRFVPIISESPSQI